MQENTYRIALQHEYARDFFNSALMPDFEELDRRDAFLSSISAHIEYKSNGNMTTEIPDIDVRALMAKKDKYLQIGEFLSCIALEFDKTEEFEAYSVINEQDIAA